MHAARLDTLQSVTKQRNASLLREMTREGIIVGLGPINYQKISATAQQDYYAFTIAVGQPTGGSEVDLKVGGVMLPEVLIDSGASCNVIDQATWEH